MFFLEKTSSSKERAMRPSVQLPAGIERKPAL
jgi:hypothetical protein